MYFKFSMSSKTKRSLEIFSTSYFENMSKIPEETDQCVTTLPSNGSFSTNVTRGKLWNTGLVNGMAEDLARQYTLEE